MSTSRLTLIALGLALCCTAAQAQTTLRDSLKYSLDNKTITERGMNREQVTNPLEAINGRVAGLTIQKSNNGVAAMSAVRLRGTTSLTGGNDPLVIIDGVLGNLSTLSSIYPADIESFKILSDATETAMYGSRGASGVIEVTTKKGTAGAARVSYNGSTGITAVYKNLDMLGADGYREACTSRGLMLIDKGYNTNWQKAIEHTGFQHDHHVAFSGGNTSNGYRVALGYIDHEGVIVHERMRNFTSNMSMHQSMFDNLLHIDVGMFGNIQKNATAVYDQQKTFYSAATWNPTYYKGRNASGGYDGFTYANQITHPLALMDSRTSDKATHMTTHAKLTFDLMPGLKLDIFGAYSHNETERSQYLPTTIWAHGQAYRGTDKAEQLMGNIVLNCDKLLATVHHINLTALASAQRDTYTGFHTTTTNFSDNTLGYNSIQAGALTLWEGTGSYKSQPTMASVMGKASYDYASRYYLTATLRADGSSKFGDNHKWGYFPSVSASWAVTGEPWMQGCASWLANLKLNVGYGWSGNQGGIDNYMSMNIMEPSAVVPVGQEAAVSMASLRNANPDLKWETRKTVNLGLEAALLENRLIATLAYYNSKTCDMLYMYDVSTPPFPYKNLLANLGSMRNRGLELSLGFTPVHTRDLELNINTNWTFQQTKLLSLSGKYGDYDIEGPAFKDIASLNGAGFHGGYNHIVYQIVGQPLGVFYLPHCTGLKSNGKGGYTYEIADLDGDHNIDISNGKDRRVCGQAIPKVLMGTNVSLRYKLLDISLQVNGAFGHKIYNGTALTYMNMNSLPGYNVLAKAPASNIMDQTATDYWLEKGDYVNFDYLTIGINVPLRETARKYVKSLRVALTCNNLATITSYSGLTPMINSSTVGSTLGLDDKNVYPLARTYTLGVQLTF